MYLPQHSPYRIPLTRRQTLLQIFDYLKPDYKSLEIISHFNCFYLVRQIQEYPLKHAQFGDLSPDPLKAIESCNNSDHLLFCFKTSNKNKTLTTLFHTTTASFGSPSIPNMGANPLHSHSCAPLHLCTFAPLHLCTFAPLHRRCIVHCALCIVHNRACYSAQCISLPSIPSALLPKGSSAKTPTQIHYVRPCQEVQRYRTIPRQCVEDAKKQGVDFSGKGKLRSYTLTNQRSYTFYLNHSNVLHTTSFAPSIHHKAEQEQYPPALPYVPIFDMVAKQEQHPKDATTTIPLLYGVRTGRLGKETEGKTRLLQLHLQYSRKAALQKKDNRIFGSTSKMHKVCNQQSIPFFSLAPLRQRWIKGKSQTAARVAKTFTNKKTFTTLFCSLYLSWYATKADLEISSPIITKNEQLVYLDNRLKPQEKDAYGCNKPIFQESTLPLLNESDQVTFANSKVVRGYRKKQKSWGNESPSWQLRKSRGVAKMNAMHNASSSLPSYAMHPLALSYPYEWLPLAWPKAMLAKHRGKAKQGDAMQRGFFAREADKCFAKQRCKGMESKPHSLAESKKSRFFSERFDIFPGQFLVYGDNINSSQNIVTTESGQVLYIDSEKATLRKAQTVLIYSQAIIAVFSEEWIKKGTPLMSLSYQKLVTGDIVQGLPKIEQFFEAPVLKDGTFWGGSLQAKLNQFFQESKEGKDGSQARPLAEAVRKGFSEIQRVLVEGVQRVYISQGVLIADKHLEVIVRQMTCKGRILYSGDTGFLRNELVSLDKIENVNQVIYGQKALYHPQVRGITDASLESESFLSAASFQETTRVLSRDAIIGKTDLMRGLKERVIVGELIQAGTGLATNGVYNLV